MKNELRLGNWIESDNKEWDSKKKEWNISRVQFQINEAQMRNILFTEKTEFDFIPLNQQWLKDFGFKEDKATMDLLFDYLICLERQQNELFIVNTENKIQYKIEYVHELQNIVFALTGKELIKDVNSNTTKG